MIGLLGAVAGAADGTRIRGLVALGSDDDPFERCRPLITEGPERWPSYRCVYGVARQHDRLEQAAAEMDAILARNGRDGAALSIRASCAVLRAEEDMLGWVHRAIDALEAEGDQVNAAYTYLQLASLQQVDDPVAAGRSLERAVTLARRSGDPKVLAWAQLDHARLVYADGGDLDALAQVLAELRPTIYGSKDYMSRVNFLGLEEDLYGQLGQHERVLETQQELLRLHRLAHDDFLQARVLGHLVVELWDDPQRVRELFGVGVTQLAIWTRDLARRSDNPRAELQAELLLDELRMVSKEDRFARCSALAERVDNRYMQSRCLAARALYRLERDPEAAERDLEQAERWAEGLGLEHLWVGIVRLAMLWQQEPRARALAASLVHLDELEDVFRRQRTTLTRAYVRADYTPHYLYVADRVLDAGPAGPSRGQVDTALRIVERMRTQELLQALEARPRAMDPGDPRRQAHAEVSREISAVQRRLLEGELAADERTSLLERLVRLEKEERAAWAEVLRADPTTARLERSTPPGLDELQQALRPDEALLSYQLQASIALPQPRPVRTTPRLVLVTRDSVRVIELHLGPDLDALVDLFGGLFEARSGHERGPAAGLHRRLLAEALDALPPSVEHLVLVPDGPLHRLPFAALRAHPEAPPLVERYRLSQVPSLSLWLRLRRSAPPSVEGGALVLADPQIAGQGASAAGERGWALLDDEPGGLGRLPYAREEGEALVRHLGEGSELRVGESATEAGLRAGDLAQFSILHFASHAVLDDEHPERSALLLAPGSDAEDGLLQTREIAQLELHGALVVLSSCRSGSGTVVGGEGPLGLSRAFFEAGARTVVASLWRLRDDDASAIFDAFYRHLGRGLGVSAALRAAQDERRRAGAPAAAWAGIVVLGDGVPRLQTVGPEAMEPVRVRAVDVDITTTACRGRRPPGLRDLVYLADDTGPEPGRWRVDGAPLLLRLTDAPHTELRYERCSAVFPHWSLRVRPAEPDPDSMRLLLYGDAKDGLAPDHAGPTELLGDILHVQLQPRVAVPCPASDEQAAVALDDRKALLRRPWVVPQHDGPIRLVSDPPYDDVAWDLDADACSGEASLDDGALDDGTLEDGALEDGEHEAP
ncbi:MAG: CHAT domain-containing protein [Myxococcales bacterium]|nr:CHAT domain-containing protein [Myxococcales bacterium]